MFGDLLFLSYKISFLLRPHYIYGKFLDHVLYTLGWLPFVTLLLFILALFMYRLIFLFLYGILTGFVDEADLFGKEATNFPCLSPTYPEPLRKLSYPLIICYRLNVLIPFDTLNLTKTTFKPNNCHYFFFDKYECFKTSLELFIVDVQRHLTTQQIVYIIKTKHCEVLPRNGLLDTNNIYQSQ